MQLYTYYVQRMTRPTRARRTHMRVVGKVEAPSNEMARQIAIDTWGPDNIDREGLDWYLIRPQSHTPMFVKDAVARMDSGQITTFDYVR